MPALYLLECPEAGVSLVLRAKCATCARSVAAENCGQEGPAVWRDPSRSTCKVIDAEGRTGIILKGIDGAVTLG